MQSISTAQAEGWQKQVAILKNMRDQQVLIKDMTASGGSKTVDKFMQMSRNFEQMKQNLIENDFRAI